MPLTRLESTRNSVKYRARLRQAWIHLVAFLSKIDLTPSQAFSDASVAAEVLPKFVQWTHDRGVSIWVARHGVLAAQTYWRELRGRIPRAWDALRSWQMELPTSHRIPVHFEIVRALFVWAALRGLTVARDQHYYLG